MLQRPMARTPEGTARFNHITRSLAFSHRVKIRVFAAARRTAQPRRRSVQCRPIFLLDLVCAHHRKIHPECSRTAELHLSGAVNDFSPSKCQTALETRLHKRQLIVRSSVVKQQQTDVAIVNGDSKCVRTSRSVPSSASLCFGNACSPTCVGSEKARMTRTRGTNRRAYR